MSSQLGAVVLLLAGVLAALAVLTLLRGRALSAATGLPHGDVIYADDGAWFPLSEPLILEEIGLTGRPDYLVEKADGQIIPVEVKASAAPREPHEGHILQLAAYCLLVTETYGVRPTHGILQYKDEAFAVDYTDDLEDDLLDLLADMRGDLGAEDLNRDHSDWYRCSRCAIRTGCRQRLA